MTNPLTGFGDNAGAGGSSTLPAFTWATKPAAADYSGRLIRITDVGINGSLLFSDGSKWCHVSPVIYQQEAKGWLVPSLAAANAATYSQTGTTITVTSVGHNIPATVHDGKDVYLAIASGDAVAGWYSNFTIVDANTFTCESSVSQTTSGTVNTNTAATIVTPVTKTVLGRLLGLNGSLRAELLFGWLSSANSKLLRAKFGGSTYISLGVSTNSFSWFSERTIRNQNSESSQRSQNVTSQAGGTMSSSSIFSVNTAIDFNHTIELTVASANEYATLENILLEVLPS